MTEWDHGHDGHDRHDPGPDLPDHDLAWEPPGPDAYLSEPAGRDDPYGLPDDPEPLPAAADPFPPALDVDVQPGDGGPWVDPDLLGGPDSWSAGAGADPAPPADPPAALLPDLAAADGDPDAGWDTLRDSDDPAIRALALHWNP